MIPEAVLHLLNACIYICTCTLYISTSVYIHELIHILISMCVCDTVLPWGPCISGFLWLTVNQRTGESSRVLLHLLDTEHIPVMSGSVPWLYIWFSACSKKCSGFNVMQIKHHVISPVSRQMIPAACPGLHNCAKQLGKVIVISF